MLNNERQNTGISVKLSETGINTGIYRGTAYIHNTSDDNLDIIGASQGDIIEILTFMSTTVYASVLISEITSVEREEKEIPAAYEVMQNYPNPFNPETHIRYKIPKTTIVRIMVYNCAGQKIKELLNETQNPGIYEIVWDGKNSYGIPVTSGIYFYEFRTEDFVEMKKMILLK